LKVLLGVLSPGDAAIGLLLFALALFRGDFLASLLLFELHLHEDLDRGTDVVQNGQTIKLQQSVPLLPKLVLIEVIYLIVGPDLYLQVQINDSLMENFVLLEQLF